MSKNWSLNFPLVLLLGTISVGGLCGCQTTIGGQTLPSAYYLRDDVQYFPAGPEFLLPNTKRAIEEYNAQQAELTDDTAARPGF